MDVTLHSTFLPHDDADVSLAFYRDILGFEVRRQVEYGGMHWNTVGPPGQPDVNIVLHPPGADPGVTDDERRTIAEMMAKGTYASLLLATASTEGAPHLVPLSLAWVDERVVIAVAASSVTARNLATSGLSRLAVGHTRDVVMMDAVLERSAGDQERP
jgi:catechol 2,3-dioxygenase-like lactoylglutathione lyase family enzyme